jgi:hypothetical protein
VRAGTGATEARGVGRAARLQVVTKAQLVFYLVRRLFAVPADLCSHRIPTGIGVGVELAARIAKVCVELGRSDLRALAAEAGADAVLERILGYVGNGVPDAERAAADLDALEDALARLGVDGLTHDIRQYRPVPGTSIHPPVHRWMCPQRCCLRTEGDTAAQTAPVCAITGVALERVRLPT